MPYNIHFLQRFYCYSSCRSSRITDVGIAAVSRGCSSLEMINIAYNERITDTSLISLSECLRLKVLEIRGCSCISAVGLSAIATGCRQLAVLDIKKCFNINDNGMLPLAQYSQNLKQVISPSVSVYSDSLDNDSKLSTVVFSFYCR